jgi:enoyl-CoA hydratase
MTAEVLTEHHSNGVSVVTLNRPQAMNALSASLRSALCDCMDAIRANDAVRAVVLTGAGERAFTAGLDLKELGADPNGLNAASNPDPRSQPVNAVIGCGKPVIGAINGVAITGGFELALACDILIASTNARFADTHALVGIMPGWGLSQKLSRIIGSSRAREMSFSGRFIDAQTAQAWGLVNRVVPPERLLPEALDLAGAIAAVEPDFLRAYRQLIESGQSLPYATALEVESAYSAAYNANVKPEDIERRRKSVMERGRAQTN